jgi:hypothetical protein
MRLQNFEMNEINFKKTLQLRTSFSLEAIEALRPLFTLKIFAEIMGLSLSKS